MGSSFHKLQIVTQTLQNCLIPNVNGYPRNEYQDSISDVTQGGRYLGCIHLLNTHKYCDNTRKYCGNT